MSQLAQFFVADRDRMESTRRELDEEFRWSGYYFVVLLTYLDENGVPLMDSDVESPDDETFVFTEAHKSHLPRLDPAAHDADALRQYFEEFNQYEDAEAGRAMQDALATLRRRIGDLDDSSVLLLTVG